MFVLDDLVKAPFQGFMFLAREVGNAVQKEQEDERARLMTELTTLHKQLEEGLIEEADFDELEAAILDRLEQFDAQ
jgi:hypothetical protein